VIFVPFGGHSGAALGEAQSTKQTKEKVMAGKTDDLKMRIEAARAQQETVEAKLASLNSTEAAASQSTAAYVQWRADCDRQSMERERLAKLIEALEAEIVSRDVADVEATLRARYAEKLKINFDLAKQIKKELTRAREILFPLLRAVAAAAQEDMAINSKLPEDLHPLASANHLARGKSELPRTEISNNKIWLWTRADGGHLIGDQDAVEDLGNGRGRLRHGSRLPCVQALFEKREYHPREPMVHATPLWHMRIPYGDAPGGFDGSLISDPRRAIAALDQAVRGPEADRPVEIELRPIPSIGDAANADAPADGAS
jgi:hypothetical protein